ncbi:hypothetical protein Vretifemale_19062, partial [Volvox reticuliferus]
GGGGGGHGNKRSASTRLCTTSQGTPQGILKTGLTSLALARMSAGDAIDREPLGSRSDLRNSFVQLDSPERLRPALPGIIAAATAATADKELNVRRGRSSVVMPPS